MQRRLVLSVAVPERGVVTGGMREIDAESFRVPAETLGIYAAGLSAWARGRLVAAFVPLGLYLAECEIARTAEDGTEEDPLCVRLETFAWRDLDAWPLDPWVHPDLITTDRRR